MRSLNYPRTVSMENFRVANFKLTAEIIFWLVKRFAPKFKLSDNIEDERARVEFIKTACVFFYQNLKVQLNPKKLYAADGHAVQELLKVAKILYDAKKTVESDKDFSYGQELDISSKKNDLTQMKNISGEIVDLGLNLLDLLDKEKGLKQSREDAITYLDSISKDDDSTKGEEIQKKIMGILSGQEEALEKLDYHVNELKQKENELNQELQVKKVELERAEKRLESLQHASPSHQNELMQYENDLSIIYKMYVEKIRNQAYLENRLQNFQRYEETNQNSLKGIIERNKAGGEKIFNVGDGVEIQPGDDQEQGEEEGQAERQVFEGEEDEEENF
jgi:clusterin-associated protein 1